jgi:hypothetical protein
MSARRVTRRNITLPVRPGDQPPQPPEPAGPAQTRKRRRTAQEQPQGDADPVLAALTRIERRLEAVEARNEQLSTRCNDLEASHQDQLIQAIESIDELRQHLAGSRRQSLTVSPVNAAPLLVNGNDPALNILSRWPWVDRALIQSIADGEFDIHSLPKLHSDESLRKKHTTSAIEGFFIPINNAKNPELRDGNTKLLTAFKDINVFLSAWYVYIMIRGSFHPNRYFGLIHWTERLNHFHHSGFPWPAILSYVTRYFQTYQNASPESWLSVDQELMSSHLVVGMVKHYQGPPKGDKKSYILNEKCNNYNDERKGCNIEQRLNRPCVRRHTCNKCDKLGHPAYKCPNTSNSSKLNAPAKMTMLS